MQNKIKNLLGSSENGHLEDTINQSIKQRLLLFLSMSHVCVFGGAMLPSAGRHGNVYNNVQAFIPLTLSPPEWDERMRNDLPKTFLCNTMHLKCDVFWYCFFNVISLCKTWCEINEKMLTHYAYFHSIRTMLHSAPHRSTGK